MCGIAGIFFTDREARVDPQLLQRMVSVLAHRGPDDQGIHLEGSVGIGTRRLRVIDPEGGGQPSFNEDRSVVVVFNGEIYNFRDLRRELTARGHHFASRSDTEVIVHAYEEYGEACVERLRGMFAFALWDARRRQLFLARDRIGIKPLYYFWDGRKFLFGSEIKSILQDQSIDRSLDPQALDDYLALHYIGAPKSIYQQVRKLRPAHTLRVSAAGLVEREYWDLVFEPRAEGSESDHIAGVRHHLRESVQLHLQSDAPVGVFLSGGVDSSAVAVTMADLSEAPIETVSMGFDVADFDELRYAREVATSCGAHARERTLGADAAAVLDTLVWHYDEPFADSSMVPTYHISKMARERLTVCLAGDGGDEVFAGYPRFHKFEQLCREDPDAAEQDYFYRKGAKAPGLRERIYGSWLRRAVGDYHPFSVLRTQFERSRSFDPVSRIQYVEIKTYLTGDLLTKVDRASMAHGLEVRVPFLDHEFMEYVAGIPASYKLRNGVTKYILKQAMRGRLSDELMSRPKMGFSIPLVNWLRHELKPLFEDRVLTRSKFVVDVVDLDQVRLYWNEHLAETHDHNRFLWSLLVLETWARRFL